MTSYKERLNTVNTFIFDVDGVLTDGKIILYKGDFMRSLNSKDGYAIQYASKLGYKTIASLQLLVPIEPLKNISVEFNKVNKLQIPLRTFTPIEEMAYHDLDNLLHEENLPAKKFLFE